MGEAREYINKLIKERNLSEPQKKKKKKGISQRIKDIVGGTIERLKFKKKKGTTLPSGVRTPEQIKEFRRIMGWKNKPTTTTGVRG